ncbi:MAG: iron-containing alcohol dehydrogenase [bacterium]
MAVDLLDLPNGREFIWRDGARLVVFGGGALGRALESLRRQGWERFELLTTQRALRQAPLDLAQAATAVHLVAPGRVSDCSASIIDEVTAPSLVALGGGRVIDVAKAIAAVRGGRVAAIPTTLSGAEMTGIHRLPNGHEAPRRVRPAIVFADPALMTDLDQAPLRATAMNALAHGAEALYGPGANPVATLAALRGAELIAAALDQPREGRDRAALALGALLSAHAVDSAGLGYHHAAAQELVRVMGLPHAETNAALLVHTMEAMRVRYPQALDALAEALGCPPDGLGQRLQQLGGGPRSLAAGGADRAHVEAAVDAIRARVANAPITDPPDRDEIRALIEAAW